MRARHSKEAGKVAEAAFRDEPGRAEYDAKLEALESRVDGRLAVMGGRLAAMEGQLAAMDGRLAAMESKFDGKFDRLFDRLETVARDAADAKTAASNMKWNILFTALGSVGVMLAAWAMWAQGIDMVSGILKTAAE